MSSSVSRFGTSDSIRTPPRDARGHLRPQGALAGGSPDEDVLRRLAAGVQIESLVPKRETLEDVFVRKAVTSGSRFGTSDSIRTPAARRSCQSASRWSERLADEDVLERLALWHERLDPHPRRETLRGHLRPRAAGQSALRTKMSSSVSRRGCGWSRFVPSARRSRTIPSARRFWPCFWGGGGGGGGGCVCVRPFMCVLFELNGVLSSRGSRSRRAGRRREPAGDRLRRDSSPTPTARSRGQTLEKLERIGFWLDPEELVAPVRLARRQLREQAGHRRVALIMNDAVKADFEGLEEVGEAVDAVIMELSEPFGFQILNRAFRHVMDGAELMALPKNRFWLTAEASRSTQTLSSPRSSTPAARRVTRHRRASRRLLRLGARRPGAAEGRGGDGRRRRRVRHRRCARRRAASGAGPHRQVPAGTSSRRAASRPTRRSTRSRSCPAAGSGLIAVEPSPFNASGGGLVFKAGALGGGSADRPLPRADGDPPLRRPRSRLLTRRGHELIVYDARAHGESDPAPGEPGYGYPQLAGDLATVLDEPWEIVPPWSAATQWEPAPAVGFALEQPSAWRAS